jgi:hypothetical protein
VEDERRCEAGGVSDRQVEIAPGMLYPTLCTERETNFSTKIVEVNDGKENFAA